MPVALTPSSPVIPNAGRGSRTVSPRPSTGRGSTSGMTGGDDRWEGAPAQSRLSPLLGEERRDGLLRLLDAEHAVEVAAGALQLDRFHGCAVGLDGIGGAPDTVGREHKIAGAVDDQRRFLDGLQALGGA